MVGLKSWIEQRIKHSQTIDGPAVKIEQTPHGRVPHIAFPAAAIPEYTVLVLVTAAPTAGVYPVALYANGKNAASTGTGTVEVLNLSLSSELPIGTWLIARSADVTITGGS